MVLRVSSSWLLFFIAVTAAVTSSQEVGESETVQAEPAPFREPSLKGQYYFFEWFSEHWQSRWNLSENPKYTGTWEVSTTETGIEGDMALIVGDVARHHAISSQVAPGVQPCSEGKKAFIVQYEVKLQNGLECGGAYLKLLSQNKDGGVPSGATFKDDTPYTIMFGPDKCGYDNKIHFIFRHENPITHEFEEKHLMNPPQFPADTLSHLYTLVVNCDNTFEVLVDRESVANGNLLEDFQPSVNPPKTIDDPTDHKPLDWVDEPEIPDPDDIKPEDWDESAPRLIPDMDDVKPYDWDEDMPEYITDMSSRKPEDWDDDLDGEWTAPEIPNPNCEDHGCGPWERSMMENPEYRGKWYPEMVPNPAYKGEWQAKQIPNPNYFEDAHPAAFSPAIAAVGIELWTMTDRITFDNVLLTAELATAEEAAALWEAKHSVELLHHHDDDDELGDHDSEGFQMLREQVDEVISIALDYAFEKPYVVLSTALACLLPFTWLCCCLCRSSNDEQVKERKDEKKKEGAEKEKEKKEDNKEDKKEEKKEEKEVNQRKSRKQHE